jgi:fido (protein-threonine AMPylation protein)
LSLSGKSEDFGIVDTVKLGKFVNGEWFRSNGTVQHHVDYTQQHAETAGFSDAWRYAKSLKHSHKITKPSINEYHLEHLHKLLFASMTKTQNNHLKIIPGKYSTGFRTTTFRGVPYEYAMPYNIEREMKFLFHDTYLKWDEIHEQRRHYPQTALLAHMDLMAWFIIHFLEIHPFGDGNGRTVRLLYSFMMECYGFPMAMAIVVNRDRDFLLSTRNEELGNPPGYYERWVSVLVECRTVQSTRPLVAELIATAISDLGDLNLRELLDDVENERKVVEEERLNLSNNKPNFISRNRSLGSIFDYKSPEYHNPSSLKYNSLEFHDGDDDEYRF